MTYSIWSLQYDYKIIVVLLPSIFFFIFYTIYCTLGYCSSLMVKGINPEILKLQKQNEILSEDYHELRYFLGFNIFLSNFPTCSLHIRTKFIIWNYVWIRILLKPVLSNSFQFVNWLRQKRCLKDQIFWSLLGTAEMWSTHP